ncbi:MAG: SMC-Scp complex subunit ScpB [Xanthomonadaceae bacterium]|nr:SMC-Scp complex subunit ScpB [Xanthomonadaceae bacterium]
MASPPLTKILEAALLAAGEPLPLERLQELFPEAERPSRAELRQALAELAEQLAGRSIELKEVASGYRLQVRREFSPWVSRLWEERPTRYSRALLETLAVIAYRQPVTRAEIEEIRGVSIGTPIIRTLQEREWIRVVGHRDVPGRPAMYGTTKQFLDYFNLKSLSELPTLLELRSLDDHPELDLRFPEEGARAAPQDDDERT